MVTLRFVLVCWTSWASFVFASPVSPLIRQAASPPNAALPGAPGPSPVTPINAPARPQPDQPDASSTPTSTAPDYQGKEPCAVASEMIAPQLPDPADADTAPLPTLPAQIGYDCMMSVPLNKSAAMDLMVSLQPYLEWQSTTAFLKNPPDEYVEKIQKPVDVMGMFSDIMDNLKSDKYTSEYAVSLQNFSISQATESPI